jgi:hypothetical protein
MSSAASPAIAAAGRGRIERSRNGRRSTVGPVGKELCIAPRERWCKGLGRGIVPATRASMLHEVTVPELDDPVGDVDHHWVVGRHDRGDALGPHH